MMSGAQWLGERGQRGEADTHNTTRIHAPFEDMDMHKQRDTDTTERLDYS